jgi:competence protein ComEC
MERWLAPLAQFWRQAPALLYGLALLFGCSAALQWRPILLLPIACLWSPLLLLFCQKRTLYYSDAIRLLMGALLALLGFFYVDLTIQLPQNISKQEGSAIFAISDYAITKKHFGQQARYRGKLISFTADGQIIGRNIPCSINLSDRYQWPPADRTYKIDGTLIQIAPHCYSLTPDKEKPWQEIVGTWSFASLRQKMKNEASSYIHQHVSDKRSADFLAGITTGDFEDRLIAQELGRFGVQHIMAISGFHFAIVASTLGFLLYMIFPRNMAVWLLIAITSLYFLFLGNSPSIMRAWAACLIGLLGMTLQKKGSGLNSLGVGLLLVLMVDPILLENIGFQFSFVATAGILLFYPLCDLFLAKVWKSRALESTSKMNVMNQHGYCILIICRQAIALTGAVSIAALPLTLFYFNKFPLMGFIYNLFFPFMVSLSMMMLIFGTIAAFLLPPVGDMIHAANGYYTYWMLEFAYGMPKSIDFMIRASGISAELIVGQICIVFLTGIYVRNSLQAET